MLKLLVLESLDSGGLIEVNRLEDLYTLFKILAKLEVVEQLNCQLVLFDLIERLFGRENLLCQLMESKVVTVANKDLHLKRNCFTKGIAVWTAEGKSQLVDVFRGKCVAMDLNGNLELNGFHGLEIFVHGQVDGLTRQAFQLNRVSHAEEHTSLPGPLSAITHFDRHHKKLARNHMEHILRHFDNLATLHFPGFVASFATSVAGAISKVPLLHALLNLFGIDAEVFKEFTHHIFPVASLTTVRSVTMTTVRSMTMTTVRSVTMTAMRTMTATTTTTMRATSHSQGHSHQTTSREIRLIVADSSILFAFGGIFIEYSAHKSRDIGRIADLEESMIMIKTLLTLTTVVKVFAD